MEVESNLLVQRQSARGDAVLTPQGFGNELQSIHDSDISVDEKPMLYDKDTGVKLVATPDENESTTCIGIFCES